MSLGVGDYEVMLADRGGGTYIGRITNVTRIKWGRIRDDISAATITVHQPNPKCADLLKNAKTVRNEVVILRNGVRVWEGPIIRLEYGVEAVEIDCRDVLWYASRRALETHIQWNMVHTVNPDGTYHFTGVDAIQALLPVLQGAYGDGLTDPYGFNVGQFLTPIAGPEDPASRREFPAFSRTIWEVLDALAEDGGVDYVVTGRRIMWWDVHLRPMILNRMTDEDFLGSMLVSEYGSQLATRRHRTDTAGLVTSATADASWITYYGPIDDVQSVPEESQSTAVPASEPSTASPATAEPPTPPVLTVPAPVAARLPANTRLDPCVDLDINELIPGLWVPIYSTKTIRPLETWMKLQEVSVTVENGDDVVNVTLIQPTSTWVDLP